MRIGLITGEYPPMQGGVGDFTCALAAALAEQGHALYILTDQRGHDEPNIYISNTIKHWDWSSLLTARRWARANRLDVVNIQYETVAFGMSLLVHWLPDVLGALPTFTTFHDLHVPYLFPKAGRLRYQVLLRLARHSAGVIVTNEQDEQKLRVESGIRRLIQIPIGSNIQTQPPLGYDRVVWRQQLGISPQTFLIGYFGFLNASKGVDTLLQGTALALQGGLDAHLLMIGGQTGASDPTNASYTRRIEAQMASLDLMPRVQWTGFADQAQVSGHLLACDVIVLPFTDGLSLRRGTFLAALAHGCPIISTTPAIALPELDGSVYLIPPQSPADLAKAIVKLAADPDARTMLSRKAAALAQGYSWTSIAARTAQFLDAASHFERHPFTGTPVL